MAFALKVKKSQASLNGCPFMEGETINENQRRSTASSFSSFEQVSQELEKEAVGVDFKETAEIIGGVYEALDGKGSDHAGHGLWLSSSLKPFLK